MLLGEFSFEVRQVIISHSNFRDSDKFKTEKVTMACDALGWPFTK